MREARRFRLEGGRLEILDETDEVRLVLVQKTPLPGQPANLVGSAWSMVIDEKEAVGEPSTTLAFLSDYITAGAIACRAYVAPFRVEDGRVRFPAMSMTGTTEGCAGHQLDSEGSYTDQLSLSYDYSVEETGSGKLLRIRTKNGEVLMFEPLLPVSDSRTE